MITIKWLTQYSQYSPQIQWISSYHGMVKNRNQLQMLVMKNYKCYKIFVWFPSYLDVLRFVESWRTGQHYPTVTLQYYQCLEIKGHCICACVSNYMQHSIIQFQLQHINLTSLTIGIIVKGNVGATSLYMISI